MIQKTVRQFRRRSRTWARGYATSEEHIERVKRETWWLLGVVPLYSREWIIADNL